MADPINAIAEWLQNLLTGWGMAPGLALVIRFALGVIVIATVMLVLDIFLVWLERKVVARFQVRLGPNRLGRYGLLQPFADVLKLLIKEDTTPLGADKFLYNLAPIIALATVLLLWGVIPYDRWRRHQCGRAVHCGGGCDRHPGHHYRRLVFQ